MTDLPDKTLLRPKEVADYFSVSKKTILRWCEETKLDYCKPNGMLRIFRTSVVQLIEKTKNIHIESIEEVEAKISMAKNKSRRIISRGI